MNTGVAKAALGIKRPLVGMETRKNVSAAEDVLLLGIKNPQ